MKSKIIIRIKNDDRARTIMRHDGIFDDVIGQIGGKKFTVASLKNGVAEIRLWDRRRVDGILPLCFFRASTPWHIGADCYDAL